MKILIKTPARLHMGLIDMNGELGRLFGGLGVGINRPNVILEARPAKKFLIVGKEIELATSMAKRFFNAYHTKTNVYINIKQTIPGHVGLGSGTQLALSISTALAKVLNVKASTQELAIAMGRAKRTGVGTAIFQKGGFVVDGGRIAQNCVCIAEKFPPLIYRQKFPEEWRFIVAVPNVKKGLVSDQEKTAFSKVPIMPSEQVGKMCRLIMLKLLPAIAEKDLENFGDALTQIQVITGNAFANVQGGTYSSQASSECITLMQQLGIHGVGQSSWGPTIYGVTEKENAKQIRINIQTYLRKTVGGQVFVAKANNKGATIKIIR